MHPDRRVMRRARLLLGLATLCLSPGCPAATAPRPDAATHDAARADAGAGVSQVGVVFPDGSGVINLRRAPYNARGDGVTDDTAAIQRALSDHPNADRILYLPAGTYRLSAQLHWPEGPMPPGVVPADYRRTILQGQGPGLTTLRLQDSAPGFTDPNQTSAVILIPSGPSPSQRVRNAVRDLTVDIGQGNRGAIGIQFLTNGQGGLRSVNLVAPIGQGAYGLDLGHAADIGPALFKRVSITGFSTGVRVAQSGFGLTFEFLTLTGQSLAGLQNRGQAISLRGLLSSGEVPAVQNLAGGVLTLIDGVLTGTGGAGGRAAIENREVLYARNLTHSGFQRLIDNTAGTGLDVDALHAEEFVSHRPLAALNAAPAGALALPIADAPVVPWDPPEEWASVVAYGAGASDRSDDSPAVQAALDSGKRTVYFPPGQYLIGQALQVRGRVRRVIGLEARLIGAGRLELREGDSPAVVIERFDGLAQGVVQASSRTLLLSSVTINQSAFTSDAPCYQNSGPGDLFVEDVYCPAWVFDRQRVWARQLAADQQKDPALPVHVRNRGGTLWLLGLRADNGGIAVQTSAGGKTEILGAHVGAAGEARTRPMFLIQDSQASFAGVLNAGGAAFYPTAVSEQQGGDSGTLPGAALPARSVLSGFTIPLYVSR